MVISTSISSLSSSSFTSSNSSIADLTETWPLPRRQPKPSPPTQVEFWYDDEEDEEVPMVAIDFLDECGVCKRRLGAGRDTYMCGGEAVFCSSECRSEWMGMKEHSDEEKRRRRTVTMMKKIHGSVVGERRDLQKKPCYSFSTDPAAKICRPGTVVAA